MSTKDQLGKIIQKLDEGAPRLTVLDQYWRAEQPLGYLTKDARIALGTRFGRLVSNLPRLAVSSVAERLRVTGFDRDEKPDPVLWADWLRNDMDQMMGILHREVLALSRAYVLVWADKAGRPIVTVESAHQVTARRDPATRQIVEAVKRYEKDGQTWAILYHADKVYRFRSNSVGATVSGFELQETLNNPYGVVPMVEFRNSDRLLDEGVSEMADLIPLCDALNKLLVDMMVTSEYFARPRRWATGVEMIEEEEVDADGVLTGEMKAVNPFPEGHRMMLSESGEAKFGQLPGADISSYDGAVRVLLGQIQAVSALPAHYLGVLNNQLPGADSVRSAEASLTAKTEARQSTFGRSWELVARLMVATRTGVDPATVIVRAQWADAATRSIAQDADAVVKLVQANILPASYGLKKLGYSDGEIQAIRAARRAEALDATGTDLTGLLP